MTTLAIYQEFTSLSIPDDRMSANNFIVYDKLSLVVDTMMFSEWLQGELDNRGWNQSDLARAAKVNRQVISDYLNQRRMRPDEKILNKIAMGLNYPPEIVLRAAGKLPPEPEKAIKRDLLDWLFDTAHPDDQEAAIAFLQHLRERREQKEKSSKVKKRRTASGEA